MEYEADMEQWERVEAYLSGELMEDERTDFEQKIRLDSELAQAVEQARISRLAVRHYGLRNDLKAIHAQMMTRRQPSGTSASSDTHETIDSRPQPRVLPLWKYGSRIAASLLLLVLAFATVRFATLSGENLSEGRALYTVETNRGAEADEIKAQLRTAYAQGDYRRCVNLYESQQPAADPAANEANLIAGNAYLSLNQPEKAGNCFQKILSANEQLPEKPFQEDAEYYLALSLLRAGRVSEAEALFAEIRQNPSHAYHSQVSWWFYQQLQWLKWKE
jgi:tetratricopeptide (TPR) repeat protein